MCIKNHSDCFVNTDFTVGAAGVGTCSDCFLHGEDTLVHWLPTLGSVHYRGS